MNFLRLLPVFFSFLLIAAHFTRMGNQLLTLCWLLAPLLLFWTRKWSVRTIQVLIYLAAAEWLRTLYILVQWRQDAGLPWGRLVLIVGGVALFTAASASVFRHRKLREKYNLAL
ncbi:hypothetical protein [Desulforhopalus singaporensis]|uniref:Uncharacterized protein n=1 Tax=Desulforhopalus singaporensis TaxID=91360 RepID=A0A1H0JY06_9BACT|nr:hypothetical protein [Desulforhopalus singaporensis]SDO48534.1 hypothetical protein SAMN05660330_00369 [Desulforhopalus singaporensis]